ncbi:hypothetical protein [Mesobacillus subterraneus]|uniref:DUF2157 domain-containing protein n=1 Tax=Mesobacillus subterraneus TaxID=285983 RepID=A0A427TK87_9BACI|nr:hypothetical protein [Mesobacillus subterraneus]RSD24434.1 hypothetical protein EJA10_19320 [Mesobacillus subterraneus]
MDFTPNEEKRRVFRNELYHLKERGYISKQEYNTVSEAHNEYFNDLLHEKEKIENQRQQQVEKTEQVSASKTPAPVPAQIPVSTQPQPVKVRPKKSAEEIRERNISWSLNIGVIMLLIGGLFVATSNWETMASWMKAGSIALVSALFYGLAFVSYRVLKIEKTAFAFVVLGSLFLPIFTLSLGWFELLGPVLSFYGEGRFILGTISSSVLIPIYILLARKLSSRLFVWFTYIASTVSAAYLLRTFGLESDGFYLGLILFNTLLITLYHYLKKIGQHPLFAKELAIYSQANLVLSTLLLLFFYENAIFNGFNLILTAVVYLAMVFIDGRKEYHFVFSGMFVYGSYQILENLSFPEASIIGYSLLGFVFVLLPKLIDDQYSLKKSFQFTSAAVSGLAFVYITAEGMMLRSGTPSFTLFAAYLIIAANFLYLANVNSKLIFRYLSPIFLASALFEAVLQIGNWLYIENLYLPIFFIGFTLFMGGSWQVKPKFLQVIRTSSRDVGMAIMLFMVLVAFASFGWWELGLMFLLTSFTFFIMTRVEKRALLPMAGQWAAPVSLGLSVASLGEELNILSEHYHHFLGLPGSFAIAGVVLLGLSKILSNRKENELAHKTFYISHGFYASSLFFTFTAPVPNIYGESLIWLGGILMSLLLYKTTKASTVAYTAGVISLAWYLITIDSINEEIVPFTSFAEAILFPAGGWLLLGAAAVLVRKDRELSNSFAWVAHVYMAPTLLLTFIMYQEKAIWTFLIAMIVYGSNLFFVKKEWKIKSLLYAAFIAMFLVVKTAIIHLYSQDLGHYAFLTSSLLIAAFWYKSSAAFRQRTLYFLVPFSFIGIATFLLVYPYSWALFGFTSGYATALLILLHRIKWDLLAIVPLILFYYGTQQIIFQERMEAVWDILLLASLGVLLLCVGRYVYQNLWEKGGAYGIRSLDAYTVTGFIFFLSLLPLAMETFWAQIVHGLLVSAGLWVQSRRVHGKGIEAIRFIAGAYLLLPYYAAVGQITIPLIWEREVYILPFVVLVIFLRFMFKGKQAKITGYIQWAVLVIVSLLLIQDGLASNTVYDALILGSLSLISMLAGMWLRVKAYFFVGAGVLLLNVLLQTRPFWGNLPWWGYLLIAGSILIGVASFNEWNKQKGAKGEKTFFVRLKEKLILKLKNWN